MKVIPEWRLRYNTAHYNYTLKNTPSVVKDGFYTGPTLPKVNKANGLTQFICNFINWSGGRATRVSSAGRFVAGKYIYSTTRKGTADISSTINGRSVMWEVKVGKDKPSEHQLKEQAKEQAAGGLYHFVHTPEEFFYLYDLICQH